jgi:hypothetical protein
MGEIIGGMIFVWVLYAILRGVLNIFGKNINRYWIMLGSGAIVSVAALIFKVPYFLVYLIGGPLNCICLYTYNKTFGRRLDEKAE